MTGILLAAAVLAAWAAFTLEVARPGSRDVLDPWPKLWAALGVIVRDADRASAAMRRQMEAMRMVGKFANGWLEQRRLEDRLRGR